MRFEVTAETDAPVEEVWRWWTDYGSPGETAMVGHGFGAKGRRRVVEARDGHVVLDESIPLPFVGGLQVVRHELNIDHDARRIRETAVEGMPYESVWSFETTATGGTRVRREFTAERGPAKLTPAAMARPFAERDLKHHLKEFERERGGR
jgi:hypothetical protein